MNNREATCREHVRIPAQFRSHFSTKSRVVAGDGVLMDLSPGGCRIISPTGVSLGAELELCVFPGDEAHPCTIDAATVRWVRNREFGVAFSKIRAGAQRKIILLWRKRMQAV